MSLKWLLLGMNGLVLLIPVAAFFAAKLYQNHLVRQTETNLAGQAVVIAEAWREQYERELGEASEGLKNILPPNAGDEQYVPVDPVVDLSKGVLPPLPGATRFTENHEGAEWRAGAAVEPILKRAKFFNLSGARILSAEGCVVASSGEGLGKCYDDYPEIASALRGRYEAVARRRMSDEPKPSYASISRRGDIRVFVGYPIFSSGKVIGAVWMSRTSMAPLKAAWINRRPLTAAVLITLMVTVLISLFLSYSIIRPVRRITRGATAVAGGDKKPDLETGGFAPREVVELSEAIGTMTEQLSDRASYIADYAANVSHELKSPITAIQGAAELLAEEGDLMGKEQRLRFLENIEADASRMERLVTGLLKLARIQNEQDVTRELHLKSFLNQVAEAYGDKVELVPSADVGSVCMNPDHLESAVRNLLENAVRHGAEKPIELLVFREGDLVTIKVRDRGPGISLANQEKIFDRFFTTERDSGGTGLGLSIVRAVALTRNGGITFETGFEGTTFTLTLIV